MSRSRIEDVASMIDHCDPGVGVIVASPGQQSRVRDLLAERLVGAVTGGEELLLAPTARIVLLAGSVSNTALRTLNARRGAFGASETTLVFILSERELVHFRSRAADLAAALVLDERVPFLDVPVGPGAWAQYRRSMSERFGRLDLRGFARSPEEDVSWRIEAIHQDLRIDRSLRTPPANPETPSRLTDYVRERFDAEGPRTPIVILGHPGSGKTFFLRWCAMTILERPDVFALGEALPVLAPLSAYSSVGGGRPLFDHLRDQMAEAGLEIAGELESLAESGRVVFLLDGLDEAPDPAARRRIGARIRSLAAKFPRCPVLVTSRVAGYQDLRVDLDPVTLSPFEDEDVHAFLVRWCELYSVDRLGEGSGAAERGRREGEQLAKDVANHPEIHALAGSPLLLTVLAMVHRAGVRLPDHRVELYSHASRILVERWNRIRGLESDGRAPPIKTSDAVRLLGPVALELIERGERSSIPEETLSRILERALAARPVGGIESAAEALDLFRDSLGLLVEQGPGLYGFLHLTLGEYFAAWELVRTGGLERLAADPKRAFRSEWREVLLLAVGELGVNRADDERQGRVVRLLVNSARRRLGRPIAGVPSLLAGLLADDPSLDPRVAKEVVDELIPKWWFRRRYGLRAGMSVVTEAMQILQRRQHDGPCPRLVTAALQAQYGRPIDDDAMGSLPPFLATTALPMILYAANVDHAWAVLSTPATPLSRS
jgi:hypothetical protein